MKTIDVPVDIGFAESKRDLIVVMQYPDLPLSDKLQYAYYWARYWRANARVMRTVIKRDQHGKKINNLRDIVNFNHQLKQL